MCLKSLENTPQRTGLSRRAYHELSRWGLWRGKSGGSLGSSKKQEALQDFGQVVSKFEPRRTVRARCQIARACVVAIGVVCEAGKDGEVCSTNFKLENRCEGQNALVCVLTVYFLPVGAPNTRR